MGDLTIPSVQAGSSIMPAKINPVIPKYVMQLSYRIRGQALTVDYAVAQRTRDQRDGAGLGDALTTMFEDLTAAATTFADRCVDGLNWDGAHRHHRAAHRERRAAGMKSPASNPARQRWSPTRTLR